MSRLARAERRLEVGDAEVERRGAVGPPVDTIRLTCSALFVLWTAALLALFVENCAQQRSGRRTRR